MTQHSSPSFVATGLTSLVERRHEKLKMMPPAGLRARMSQHTNKTDANQSPVPDYDLTALIINVSKLLPASPLPLMNILVGSNSL